MYIARTLSKQTNTKQSENWERDVIMVTNENENYDNDYDDYDDVAIVCDVSAHCRSDQIAIITIRYCAEISVIRCHKICELVMGILCNFSSNNK